MYNNLDKYVIFYLNLYYGVYQVKKWLFVLLLSILLVGCSDDSSNDLLSEVAYYNLKQSFSLDEEKSRCFLLCLRIMVIFDNSSKPYFQLPVIW